MVIISTVNNIKCRRFFWDTLYKGGNTYERNQINLLLGEIYNYHFRNVLSLFWKHSDLAENARETRLNSCLRRGRLNHRKVNKLLLNKRIILAIILLSLDLSTLQNHLHFLLSSYKKTTRLSIESDILLPFFYYHRQR